MDNLLTPEDKGNILHELGYGKRAYGDHNLNELMEAGAQAYHDKLQVTDEKMVEWLKDRYCLYFCGNGGFLQGECEDDCNDRIAYAKEFIPLLKAKEQQVRQEERERIWKALNYVGIELYPEEKCVRVKHYALLKPDREYQDEFWQALQ